MQACFSILHQTHVIDPRLLDQYIDAFECVERASLWWSGRAFVTRFVDVDKVNAVSWKRLVEAAN
tara:strand:- start:1317 stop:1511 length:195 start_codon:yes stop_codon:yes gene_type:complete